ncbi:TetR/AcrR family transcriptional regulator [Rhizobium sp. YTU87027]|uniref:TetR/AcrR family transcriptional regulator n=1 Tax=Rhizobium sp. YTU87027 TaxID=3417741 RepID=UPI003D69D35C
MSSDDAASKRSYHHGELRRAMIEATDAILRENGVEGFSLREAARRAGVSPGAPAHHFGNAAGLLTEVAILGYDELGRYLNAAEPHDATPASLRALAKAYVMFALDHSGRFRLMFRKDLVNRSDSRYSQASRQALTPLARAATFVYDGHDLEEAIQTGDYAGIFAAWSTAHGIAHLALEEKLNFATDGDRAQDFLDRLLPAILAAQWPG